MIPTRTLAPLALGTAGLWAGLGAMELSHDQPTVLADAIDYWIEGAFTAALAGSVAVLAALAMLTRGGRAARVGWTLAAGGHVALLVAAATTAIRGRDSLDALFFVGFLSIVIGYLTLAVVDARKRLVPARAGLLLAGGFVASVFVDEIGAGGIVLAATWAGVSRTLTRASSADLANTSVVGAGNLV